MDHPLPNQTNPQPNQTRLIFIQTNLQPNSTRPIFNNLTHLLPNKNISPPNQTIEQPNQTIQQPNQTIQQPNKKFPLPNLTQREYRIITWYEWLQGTSQKDCLRKLHRFISMDAGSRSSVQRRYQKFNKGNFKFEDEKKTGRKSILDEDELKKNLEESNKIKTAELAKKFKVCTKTIRNHLHKLGHETHLEGTSKRRRFKDIETTNNSNDLNDPNNSDSSNSNDLSNSNDTNSSNN